MNYSELIADEIYNELFENYLEEQVDELNNADIDELDPVYVPMFDFFRSSSEEDKDHIVDYIKEIIADTTSIILGGIDNAEPLGQLSGKFELKYEEELVSDNLQESFQQNINGADDGENDAPYY